MRAFFFLAKADCDFDFPARKSFLSIEDGVCVTSLIFLTSSNPHNLMAYDVMDSNMRSRFFLNLCSSSSPSCYQSFLKTRQIGLLAYLVFVNLTQVRVI